MDIKFLLIPSFICSLLYFHSNGQTSDRGIIKRLDRLQNAPTVVHFTNSLSVNNKGGHLQGIQRLFYDEKEYLILSGSSDLFSYYTIVKNGEKGIVISVNKILDKPYKHAGGFQIHKNLMAIGVEDNDKKNVSKVFIFRLENPEKPPKQPLGTIDRMGTFKRATAGCVGITTIKEKVLVVVGDWDTVHLDFYLVDEKKLLNEGATLELEFTLNSRKIDKSDWSDESWHSYQNINLLIDQEAQLYLAGMTSKANEENVLDLFLVESEGLKTFGLKKIYSRSFPSNTQTKFRWGAGISIKQNYELSLLSCGEHILESNILHIFE